MSISEYCKQWTTDSLLKLFLLNDLKIFKIKSKIEKKDQDTKILRKI